MRILYLRLVFSNGINGPLKAKKATKMTYVQIDLSLFSTWQTVTKVNEIVRRNCPMSIRMVAETVKADKKTQKDFT